MGAPAGVLKHVTVLAHLLDHANELREGPVELVQDAVEEGRRHVFVHAQQLCHVFLQQQRRTGLCTNHTRAHRVTWSPPEQQSSTVPTKKKHLLAIRLTTHPVSTEYKRRTSK